MRTTHRPSAIRFLLLLSVLLTLVGCGAPASTTTSPNQPAPASDFKVAIILPSPIDDKGWSQAGYNGLLMIEKELGATIAYRASVPETEAEAALRGYAQEGFDLIIGHGGEFIEPAEAVAQEFPRTKFAVSAGYAGNNSNLGALSARDWELGYLTGVVAGMKTKTGKVVFIAGKPYGHIKEQAKYFEQGARRIKGDVEVSVEYLDSWTDTAKARSVAEKHIAQGADVVVAQADAGNKEIIDAAKQHGVYAIGWSLDQNDLAPKTVVTSGLKRTPLLLLRGATLVKEGRWEGKQYKFGLRDGVIDLAPFHGLLTPQEEQIVTDVRNEILAGSVVP